LDQRAKLPPSPSLPRHGGETKIVSTRPLKKGGDTFHHGEEWRNAISFFCLGLVAASQPFFIESFKRIHNRASAIKNMHIKQICISNFRSFRHQSELHPPFHCGTNCIVGRNGSGKSNLLDAIQFVLLSPRFANLRQEERQALLHEGSGSAALNAFVEIVIDNSDKRIQALEDDEVVIRRVIGVKKDEMFLQRKRSTKSTILGLLEGAGFSKSNPYFLVQQGRIQALCLMNDAERLAVLKEVAGTTVYDTKKIESVSQMQDNNDKIDKVKEILERIEERLGQLKDETEELEQFSLADKQRRGCEYCLYDAELQKAQISLGNLEEERANHAEHVAQLHEDARAAHDSIRSLEGQIHAKSAKLRQNARLLSLLEQDYKEGTQKKTQLALECQELESQIKAAEEAQREASSQLTKVQAEIDSTEALLGELTPQLREAEAALSKFQQGQAHAAAALESLQAKQGRGKQFSTKEERDAYLRSSLEDLAASVEETNAQIGAQRDTLASCRRSIQSSEQEKQAHQKSLETRASAAATLTKMLADKRRERQSLQESRKADWRAAEQLRDQVREARHEWQQARGDSRKSMPRATSFGLQSLQTLVEQERLTKDDVLGTVLENIRLKNDKYATAVEVAAQNALFHVIVKDDEVAARLLNRLEKDKMGRVTFLPLNQLRVDGVANPGAHPVPASSDSDVCMLLDVCLSYDPKVRVAMQHVFGNKLLARSQEAASEWSAKCDMDAITLDGDLVSRKGAISGGFVDTAKSRWAAHVRLEHAKSALDRLQANYERANRRAEQVDQQNSALLQEIQKFESKHSEVTNSVKSLETNLERLRARLEQQRKNEEKLQKTTIPTLERQRESLLAEQARIEEEMGTELTETPSSRDKREVERLKADLSRLTAEMQAQSDTVAKFAAEHQKNTSLLKDNLLKRKEELTGGCMDDDDDEEEEVDRTPRRSRRLSGSEKASPSTSRARRRRSSVLHRVTFVAMQEQRQHDLEERRSELEELVVAMTELERRLIEVRNAEAALKAEVILLKDELEQMKSADMKKIKELEDAQEKSERLLNKVCSATTLWRLQRQS
jgi:structural maintenance of chromosome 3 (chondroitin sulfate proteoglycan 6)